MLYSAYPNKGDYGIVAGLMVRKVISSRAVTSLMCTQKKTSPRQTLGEGKASFKSARFFPPPHIERFLDEFELLSSPGRETSASSDMRAQRER